MAAEAIVEEVATNLEEVAEVTRRINTAALGYFVGGVVIGVGVGFYFGQRFRKEKLRKEAFEQSEAEVAEIREMYRTGERVTAVPLEKENVQDIIEKRGYSMKSEHDVRSLLRPPVPVTPDPVVSPLTSIRIAPEEVWNYGLEQSLRSGNAPYIIHEDEFRGSELGYQQIACTYYAGDDVLVDEDGDILSIDSTVGNGNLRFGHGSGSDNVVFIRNDKLEVDMEVSRLPGSYESEASGLDPNEPA